MKQLLFFSLIILVGCSDAANQGQVKTIQKELAIVKQINVDLKTKIEPEGNLVHVVFFKVKANSDQAAFVAAVKKLEEIEAVMDLEIGPFEDVGDARALSDFSHMMSMSFKDVKAYEAYQKHPIHLGLKEAIKSDLAGPPATYDFMKK